MLLLLKEYPAISKFPHRLKRSQNPFQDLLLGFASVLIFLEKQGFRAVLQMLKLSYLLFYSLGHSKAGRIAVTYDAWRFSCHYCRWLEANFTWAPSKSNGSHSMSTAQRLWSMAWSPRRTLLLSVGSRLTISFWSRLHTCQLLGETMDNVSEPSLFKAIKQVITSVRSRPASGGETLLTLPLFFKAAVQRPAFSFKMRRERRPMDERLLRLHHCWRYFCIFILCCIRCCCMCKGTVQTKKNWLVTYYLFMGMEGWSNLFIFLIHNPGQCGGWCWARSPALGSFCVEFAYQLQVFHLQQMWMQLHFELTAAYR